MAVQFPTAAYYAAAKGQIEQQIGGLIGAPYTLANVLVTTVGKSWASMYTPQLPHGDPGAVVSISPAVAFPASLGPVYFNAAVSPDPTLTSTSVDGGVLFGNLAPAATRSPPPRRRSPMRRSPSSSRTTSRSTSRRRRTPPRGRTTRRPASRDSRRGGGVQRSGSACASDLHNEPRAPASPPVVLLGWLRMSIATTASLDMCILGTTVSTQDWINLIACVGELAVAALVALRALGGPLATPLMFVSVDFFVWNFAQLAYHRSGLVELAPARHGGLADRERAGVRFPDAVHGSLPPASLADARRLSLLRRRWRARRRWAGSRRSARRFALSAVWSWAWLAGLPPAVGAHPGLAVRPPPPRGDRRGTQPNPAPAGRGDGHLAAGVDRGLGRSRLSGPPPGRGRHSLLDGHSDDRGAAVPALRPRAHPLERPFGHGAGQRGWDRLSDGVPPGGNQHGVAGPGDA